MRLRLTILLGNEAMQTGADVIQSLRDSLKGEESLPLEPGVGGVLWDENGNTVGKWEVVADTLDESTGPLLVK